MPERCRIRKQCPELAELDSLRTLLRRAWCRLAECVCHGDPGSSDLAEHRQLLDEIDAVLPREEN